MNCAGPTPANLRALAPGKRILPRGVADPRAAVRTGEAFVEDLLAFEWPPDALSTGVVEVLIVQVLPDWSAGGVEPG